VADLTQALHFMLVASPIVWGIFTSVSRDRSQQIQKSVNKRDDFILRYPTTATFKLRVPEDVYCLPEGIGLTDGASSYRVDSRIRAKIGVPIHR
jgi:hypothetical protein